MPDGVPALGGHFSRALDRLDAAVATGLPGARALSAAELAEYGERRFAAGWRLRLELPGGARAVDLLVDDGLPFTFPRVALVDAPPPLTWPHLEPKGLLCVVPESASARHDAPEQVAGHVLRGASDLLGACIRGENVEDFRREFRSYWDRDLTPGAREFVSLLRPHSPSRLVAVWWGKEICIVGENEAEIRAWMAKRYGDSKSGEVSPAAYLWLSEPLVPKQYPKTSAAVRALARDCSHDALAVLEALVENTPEQAAVVLAMPGENGLCLAAATLRAPAEASKGKAAKPIEKGFRPGRVPKRIAATRYLQAASSVERARVERADASWIHGRDRDPRQATLASKRVVVVGCGSVGGPVAELLARAGVGANVLVDPQRLQWSNVGRHRLGARFVGRFKAEALASELQADFPHLSVEAKCTDWQTLARTEAGTLESADVIVSLTGHWGSDGALDAWRLAGNARLPVVYGWTEPHACAGHAVALVSARDCFGCGFSPSGVPNLRVTEWPNGETAVQEPACGAVFQPYGPIELNHTVTLVAELVIDVLLGTVRSGEHRIWAAREEFLTACGGSWNPEWISVVGRLDGGVSISRAWPSNPDCPACVRAS